MIAKDLSEFDIDLKNSIYCGDSTSDRLLAKQLNLEFFGINLECENKVTNLLDVCNILKMKN